MIYGEVVWLVGLLCVVCQVGGVLKCLLEGFILLWYWVVNCYGDIFFIGFDLQWQCQVLLVEGVQVFGSGYIDFQYYCWVY